MSKLLLSCGTKVCAWAATAKKKIADAKHRFKSNRSAKEMERALATRPVGFRLARAISKGDVEAFKSLLRLNPFIAQQYTAMGTSEFLTINHIICSSLADVQPYTCKEEMILLALKSGADINARLHGNSWTALESAVYTKNIKLIPFLIKHGARPVDGVRGDVLSDENIVQKFFRCNAGYFRCLRVHGAPLLEIVDAFASIGLVEKCSDPSQVLLNLCHSEPSAENFVAVINRLMKSGLKNNEVQLDLGWLWTMVRQNRDGSIDRTVLENHFIDSLVASGFELTDEHNICGMEVSSIPIEWRSSIQELIAQFTAAKARKEKENILRELAIASEDIEVRPRRRM
ncbi:TPA: ankyrin repeat domain-containing protein [Stenotrophomonas maltophilia]|nr:ankyrin repeat domain-containing protein [Stenotrophomonas maltophilia]